VFLVYIIACVFLGLIGASIINWLDRRRGEEVADFIQLSHPELERVLSIRKPLSATKNLQLHGSSMTFPYKLRRG